MTIQESIDKLRDIKNTMSRWEGQKDYCEALETAIGELSKAKMRKATDSTTITMGGDGKSHRIPDELWWMIDALVRGYDEAIEMEYMNPAIAALQEVWAETIRMDRRKDNV